MRTLVFGNQTTLGEHLEFSIFRYFPVWVVLLFQPFLSTPDFPYTHL